MKNKILIFSMMASLGVGQAFAQGTMCIDQAAGGVASYLPVVRALCYAIAGVISVVGAFSVYLAYHHNPQDVKKRTLMTVGGALCFVAMSLALPQFFGLDSTAKDGGYIASNGGGEMSDGSSNLSTDEGGIPGSSILTEIPTLTDGRWVTLGDGTSMTVANYVIDVVEANNGNYNDTKSYFEDLYSSGEISSSDCSRYMLMLQELVQRFPQMFNR